VFFPFFLFILLSWNLTFPSFTALCNFRFLYSTLSFPRHTPQNCLHLVMQFSFFLAFFTLVSSTAALPTGHVLRASCDIVGCVAALAPTIATCAAALVEGGANIPVDIGCLIDATNDLLNLPDDCEQCLEEFNIKAKPAVGGDSTPECGIVECASALGSTVLDCTSALLAKGRNKALNLACFTEGADTVENLPDKCNQCLIDFNVKAKPAVDPNPKCDIPGCVAALASTVAQCAVALSEGVLNPVADSTCFAAAGDKLVNLPSDCNLCLEEFNITPKSVVVPPVEEDPNAEAEADGEGRAELKDDPIDDLADE